MELGKTGVWTTYARLAGENPGDAAKLVEELGYGVFWLGGSPRLTDTRPLLAATEDLIVATAIVNVWAYDPAELAAEYAALELEFPGRLLVGIGIGHPEAARNYSRPVTAMREFLDVLDRPEDAVPRDRRCLAALAPRMLDLSAERSLGAIPYFVPVEHTRYARSRLGPRPLLAPEVAFVLDDDTERAKATARQFARYYLGLRNYAENLLRHGFTDEDLADGGSDRLIDAVVPHGTAQEIATVMRAHLDAGADQVVLQAVGEPGIPRSGWTALAEALIGPRL
jgi:probable F420-dependent oxidoreductase